jgi:hypothetical protein
MNIRDSLRNEIWSLIQRLLAFDEPVAKWLHFKNSIAKLEKIAFVLPDQQMPKEFWSTILNQRLRIFFELSSADMELGNRFAAAFAEQELLRLTDSALQMWRHKFARDLLPDQNSRSLWHLAFARIGALFAVTLKDGPWQEDERGRFVRDCLDELNALRQSGQNWSDFHLDERRHASKKLPASLLPNSIILVEGATEAVLLPLLAECLKVDLLGERALVVPAGGANQVVKKYLYEKEIYSLPIFVILDLDAAEQSEILASSLRDVDRLHVLSDGEIEDILRLDVFVPMLNRYIASLPGIVNDNRPIKPEHFGAGVPRKQILTRLWRERGLGKFDKVGFAKFTAEDLPAQGVGRKALSEDGLVMIESLRQQSQRGAFKQGQWR